ncbi:MAG: hypothetical protein ACREEA_05985, partial [Stellaceae bacterium]
EGFVRKRRHGSQTRPAGIRRRQRVARIRFTGSSLKYDDERPLPSVAPLMAAMSLWSRNSHSVARR